MRDQTDKYNHTPRSLLDFYVLSNNLWHLIMVDEIKQIDNNGHAIKLYKCVMGYKED